MARKRISIGVAGLGRIGWQFHCREIARSPDFELAAVQDVKADRRAEAQQVYGVPSFARFSDMLGAAGLEAVVVATPTHLHREMAEEALRRGCHVLLEKPMAESAADAAAIVRTAARHRLVLTVYQPNRAAAYFQHLQKLLASGVIGEPYHVRIGAFRYVRRNDWQSLRRYGGGMLNNYGAHALDQLLQLVGYDVKRVFCNLRLVASLGDADDVVKVVVETRQGRLGEMDINQASVISPYRLQVWGSRGAIELSPDHRQFSVTYFTRKALKPKRLDRSLASAQRRYPEDQVPLKVEQVKVDRRLAVDVYADLAAAIRKGRPAFVRPEEPLAVMKLIDRCRADSGRILKTTG
jgi:predicted dehydrogenase